MHTITELWTSPARTSTSNMKCLPKNSIMIGWRISWIAFTLIVIAHLIPSGAAAAGKCTINSAHTAANCSLRNLKFVPTDIPHKSINSLDLSGNFFPILNNESFVHLQSITILYLRNNSIHTIKSGAFKMLDYLKELDLSNNKLSHIPVNSFVYISHSLLTLNMAGNNLREVPREVFINLTNLKELDLTGNSIHQVSRGAFTGLKALIGLKLRHNALESLPSDAFDEFTSSLQRVQLYDNAWVCDCHMRWLRHWLNDTDRSVWASPGYAIRCDGPAFLREKSFDEVPMEDLACKVQMKMSGHTRQLESGSNATLLCKYGSVPEAPAVWRRNSEPIDLRQEANKYGVSSWATEDKYGDKTHVSQLTIKTFKRGDIAKYDCFVENKRGAATTEYRLTLTGVEFDSVYKKMPEERKGESIVNKRSIIIAVAVVSGIVIIVIIIVLIFCSINRVQRKRKEKRENIQENIKQHFMNSEGGSNGDPASPNGKPHKPKTVGGDGGGGSLDDTLDDFSKSNATLDSTYKPPLGIDDVDHSMYPFQRPPGSPNGNTYVSYSSELTDPSEFMPPPPPILHPQATKPVMAYDSSHSHAGSATPLLERNNTPSLYELESEEPIEDYAHYPVYDSVTNSLQHPNLPPNGSNGYGNGGVYEFLPNRQNSVASYASSNNRNNGGPYQYPASYNGSMPRTPGSTRSGFTYCPRSVDGDESPLPADVYATYSHPNQYRAPPPQNNYSNKIYADYRDMPSYPATTPPPHRMTANTQKSMSVGNLGYSPVPTSSSIGTGPRKPPRIYQSREYMELTPQDSGSDYGTSMDAQNYSQSYGITPGTPV